MNSESMKRPYPGTPFATAQKGRQRGVHYVWLAAARSLWHGRAMQRRPSAAGGFFLIVAILIGVAWGLWQGMLMLGALIGTAVGIAVSVATWLIDRREA